MQSCLHCYRYLFSGVLQSNTGQEMDMNSDVSPVRLRQTKAEFTVMSDGLGAREESNMARSFLAF